MKHHIQISEWRGFRILLGKMIPNGIAHKTSANPCASRAMRGEYRKAAHHARVMRDEISDVGGVALGLRSPDEVAVAVTGMAALGDRVLVEQMVTGSVAELIVGVVRDPQYGLALLLGAGGILAEVWADNVTLLLPASRVDIESALARLRIWQLIVGYRGRKADAEAIVRAVEGIAAFADQYRNEIEELDINPLLALPDRAVAVDALIKLRATPEFLTTLTSRST